MKLRVALELLAASATIQSSAQIPFSTSPSWESSDLSGYATGAAWADLNQDGWVDLIIANGNDMGRQPVAVYYNNGGSLPPAPDWQSADVDYHGQLSVGDVNGDGYPDVAVSVYIGTAGFSEKGKVKLYMNWNGVLEQAPSWTSRDSLYTFSCAFGDADADGDLDLAVAAGESYHGKAEHDRIYFNRGGTLESLPTWQSSQAGFSYDVTWADFDNDGDLDLAFCCEQGPNKIYRNDGDSIGTIPWWTSTDASQYANSLFAADLNSDGFPELAVSDNNQLGGAGRFKIYQNDGGAMTTTPHWTSAFSGYGSGINLADVDNDGDRDLVTGGWWQPCRIYLNNAGKFSVEPQWISATGSVVEAIVFADCDADGLDTLTASFNGTARRKLFALPHAPVQRLISVVVGEDTLGPKEFCADLENGWVSCGSAPASGVLVSIRVVVSHDLDFAVSNWDNSLGNYLFINETMPVPVAGDDVLPKFDLLQQNYPNPFNPSTVLSYRLSMASDVKLVVCDILGREVAVVVNERKAPGKYDVRFDASGLASGVYLYRLTAGNFVQTRKMLLLQ